MSHYLDLSPGRFAEVAEVLKKAKVLLSHDENWTQTHSHYEVKEGGRTLRHEYSALGAIAAVNDGKWLDEKYAISCATGVTALEWFNQHVARSISDIHDLFDRAIAYAKTRSAPYSMVEHHD